MVPLEFVSEPVALFSASDLLRTRQVPQTMAQQANWHGMVETMQELMRTLSNSITSRLPAGRSLTVEQLELHNVKLRACSTEIAGHAVQLCLQSGLVQKTPELALAALS